MRGYVAITGLLFVIVTITHVARAFFEQAIVRDPGFLIATLVVVILAVWAGALLRKEPTPVRRHEEP